MEKIKKSFPCLSAQFYDILCERIKDNGFDDKRLTAAVNSVIDSCQYPTPTVAEFIIADEKLRSKEIIPTFSTGSPK